MNAVKLKVVELDPELDAIEEKRVACDAAAALRDARNEDVADAKAGLARHNANAPRTSKEDLSRFFLEGGAQLAAIAELERRAQAAQTDLDAASAALSELQRVKARRELGEQELEIARKVRQNEAALCETIETAGALATSRVRLLDEHGRTLAGLTGRAEARSSLPTVADVIRGYYNAHSNAAGWADFRIPIGR